MLVAMWQLGNCQLLGNYKGGVVAMWQLGNCQLLGNKGAVGCYVAARKLSVAR